MSIHTMRGRLLASSMITGAALLALGATAAYAADSTSEVTATANSSVAISGSASGGISTLTAAADAAATSPSTAVTEIIVTGSLIPQPNLTSVSPVTSVSSQELRLEGTTNIETMLQELPSVAPEFNQGVDNGASGTATADLRGLGSKRTLILVNGDRLMPGDPIVPSPDLNNIPVAMVDHVEVLTGGASSVYGSDAVAGVINFIMKTDFEGVRLDAQGGAAFHDNSNETDRALLDDYNADHPGNGIPLPGNQVDAATYDVTAIIGSNSADDKGNVTAYAEYRHIDPLGQGRRDYGACGLATESSGAQNAAGNIYDTHLCLGSSNSAYGKFVGIGSGGGSLADNPDGTNTFVPYAGSYGFNFGPYNYYQEDDNKYTGGYFAHYDINPMFHIYSSLMFADDTQVSQAAPSGLFFTSGPVYSINCANPLMSAQQESYVCGPEATVVDGVSTGLSIAYRLAGVPRVTDLQHTAYTIVLGTKGQLDDAWSYDAHLQYGRTSFREEFTGDVSINKINEALDVTGTADNPVCASGVSGCVPLNIFTALSANITPAMLGWIGVPAFKVGSTTEQIANLTFTGDLGKYGVKSPWAKDGFGVAVGSEYRLEQLALGVDNEYASGDLSGAGGVNPPASGSFDVWEGFIEGRAPIVQDQPFAKLLQMEAGFRYSDYSLAGSTNAYKISGEWSPTDDIRFRAGYNRAVRAPNIVELFQPDIIALESFGDPCSGPTPKASLASCEATGVSAADYGLVPDCGAAQCSAKQGGNIALKPEEADTYTAGFVVTPSMVHGLSVSVDYFTIDILNPITTVGGATILSQCISGDTTFCGLIHRDPNDHDALFGITSAQGYVIDTLQNSGFIKTSGVDFELNYHMDLADIGIEHMGGLSLHFIGTYTNNFTTEPFKGSGDYDCAGFYGLVCGQPDPKWKHEMRVSWTTPWNVLLSFGWQYIGSVKLDLNTNNPFMAAEGVGFLDSADAVLPAFNYFDISGQWRIRDKLTFRFGINNIADTNPPVVDANVLGIAGTTGFGNGNTFPGVYDTVGRTFFMGLTADF